MEGLRPFGASGLTVTVVGAGVSGLVAALTLARADVEVTVLEEHETIGLPCYCGGVVSPDYQEKIGIALPRSIELIDLHGFKFTDGVREVTVESKRTIAKVISRQALDEHLARLCEVEGVGLQRSTRGTSLRTCDGSTVVETPSKSYSSDYTILAGGIADNLGRTIGLARGNSSLLVSAQAVIRKRTESPVASIYLSERISPDFFGYAVPTDEQHCAIGVASRKADVVESLRIMAKKEGAELAEKPSMWGIWTGGPMSSIRKDNVFVVGDAAGMTKATTGGGIVFGAMSARAVANIIIDELGGEGSEGAQSLQSLTLELRKIRTIRRLMNLAGPASLMEAILSASSQDRLRDYMESVDFDFHGGLIRAVRTMKVSPGLLSAGALALRHFVEGFC